MSYGYVVVGGDWCGLEYRNGRYGWEAITALPVSASETEEKKKTKEIKKEEKTEEKN